MVVRSGFSKKGILNEKEQRDEEGMKAGQGQWELGVLVPHKKCLVVGFICL